MDEKADPDGQQGPYLKALSDKNSVVQLDTEDSVLTISSTQARHSAIVVNCGHNSKLATWLAPYVGPGMLDSMSIAKGNSYATDQIRAGLDLPDVCVRDGHPDSKDTEVRLGIGEDIVWRNDYDNDAASSMSAGAVLLLKICGALTAQYNPQTVVNVAQLVKNNTMTAVYGGKKGAEDTAGAAAELLNGLLGSSGTRTRSVKMNTNEPVLLVNNSNLSGLAFNSVVTETIEQLQRIWNIWPVRIYAGRFSSDDGTSFSISLLNVVNTDIGGPSMIQLLDAPCEATAWLSLVRREVWNGRDLLEKNERRHAEPAIQGGRESDISNQAPSHVQTSAEETKSKLLGYVEQHIEQEPRATSAHTDHPEDTDAHDDDSSQFIRDVAPMQHPTWEHLSATPSLLDLIKEQALSVAEQEDEAEMLVQSGPEKQPSEQASAGSDDEFVVVS
ncbi:hypothetical protein DV736_g3184, partial [Chaetothyriales sp. CBS 134916]